MRRRALLAFPLLLLLLSAACGDDSPSTQASPSGYTPVNGSVSPSVSPTTDPAVEPTAQPLLPDEAKTVPPPTRNTEKKTPKPRQTTTVRPSLPSGHVPDFLVGQWSGGPGGESGRYLAITADGRYERGYVSGGVESFGTVVADESTATFHDHNGSKERARLTYTDAAGIVVLSVNYAKQGYYSYVAD